MKRGILLGLMLLNTPVNAEVNMSNSPVSNSSGSVSNFGVLNMPSKLGLRFWDCSEKYKVQTWSEIMGSGYETRVPESLLGHVGVF